MENFPVYLHLLPGSEIFPTMPARAFSALILVEVEAANAWRQEVCEWLVLQGCRNAFCWGHDCEAWHDEIDVAAVRAAERGLLPENLAVLTTWHNDESLSEIFWFARNAFPDDVATITTYIIHIGFSSARSQMMEFWNTAG